MMIELQMKITNLKSFFLKQAVQASNYKSNQTHQESNAHHNFNHLCSVTDDPICKYIHHRRSHDNTLRSCFLQNAGTTRYRIMQDHAHGTISGSTVSDFGTVVITIIKGVLSVY